jgi:hypothetical protein
VDLPDLDLSAERRERVVRDARTALERAIEGSSFRARGSLADGTADRYSDIDAVWVVPNGCLQAAIDGLRRALEVVGPLFSIRFDARTSGKGRCLAFVTFAHLPVFWRFDLWIETATPSDEAPEDGVAGEGSSPESALANAVAAIKAVVRGRSEDAIGLLERGYPRVGSAYVPTGSLRADIIELADRAGRGDTRLMAGSREVLRVAKTLLPE